MLRKVNYQMIVQQKIALVQAGVKLDTRDLEAHYLARGNVPKTSAAVVAAYKAGIDLPWKTAAAIDTPNNCSAHWSPRAKEMKTAIITVAAAVITRPVRVTPS